jgi:hypothetical protein
MGERSNWVANESLSTDTVPLSESRSRRWKSPNTHDTSVLSAERPLSRDIPLVSGIANHARRPLPEELTPSRMFWKLLSPSTSGCVDSDTDKVKNRTPAAAAMRSTLRRLREIAEV